MTAHLFHYTKSPKFPGMAGLPLVPVTLTHDTNTLEHIALVDSGSTINVMPYELGLALGLSWEAQTVPLDMMGILAGAPAFGVVVTGQIRDFPPVSLIFAWTRKHDVRLILGQTNFFQEFDLLLSGSRQIFSIVPKGTLTQKS
ncbi:MAG: retroviral-like aspartic protease [bacterium]|nr:retroviral-like aspartic protease [bacterium]